MSREILSILILFALAACVSEAENPTTSAVVESTTSTSTSPSTTTTTTPPADCAAPSDTTNSRPFETKPDEEPPGNDPPQVEIITPANLSSHVMELNDVRNCYEVTIEFSAESSDSDGDDYTVEWFSSDEGFLGTGDEISATLHTIRSDTAQPMITARATDEWGRVSESQIQIIIWIPSDT